MGILTLINDSGFVSLFSSQILEIKAYKINHLLFIYLLLFIIYLFIIYILFIIYYLSKSKGSTGTILIQETGNNLVKFY